MPSSSLLDYLYIIRSTPDFGNVQKNSVLRKTQSQPSRKVCAAQSLSLQGDLRGINKNKECSTSQNAPHGLKVSISPSSPTGKDIEKSAKGSLGLGAGSPKPKKNIFDGFRNPLKSKSKNHEGGTTDSCVVGDTCVGG